MRLNEVINDLHRFVSVIKSKYDLQDLWLYSLGDSIPNTIKLDSIIVNKGSRKAGVGSQVMNAITDYADEHDLRIVLTPGTKDDSHGTTSHARLIRFYKRFGFVENKGRRKNYCISASMIRDPQ